MGSIYDSMRIVCGRSAVTSKPQFVAKNSCVKKYIHNAQNYYPLTVFNVNGIRFLFEILYMFNSKHKTATHAARCLN